MSRTLELITLAATLCLLGASFASAQDAGCETDDDCAEGEKCQAGLVLACDAPCEDGPSEDGPQVPGSCVDAMLGEPCGDDADCGGELSCARTVVAVSCPEDDADCVPEETTEDGFCADNATLAASSGLAPGGAPEPASADGAAGGAAPEIMEAGVAPEGGDGSDSDSSGGDSSTCSAGGQTGVLAAWMPALLALLVLGLRRRSGPGLV